MKKSNIHFSDERWAQTRETYEKWWQHKSARMVIGAAVRCHEPTVKKPEKPLLSQFNVHLPFTAEEVVDGIEYELSQYEFIGDSYPYFNMHHFGPGVVAAFLGCELTNQNGQNSVWFRPLKEYDINTITFEYDPENPVLKRIRDIYRCAAERFEGRVLLGMPDLGGIADILSSFFPGEKLLYLLYDEPEAVRAALSRITELWHKFYETFASDMNAAAYGYTDWSELLSPTRPSYVIQSDFSFMIGDDMFRELILPDIAEQCRRLDRTLYHLDGPGELTHLDTLLAIPELNAVQWVPGAGQPPADQWLHIFDKILSAGKLAQVFWSEFPEIYNVARATGNAGSLHHPTWVLPADKREYAEEWINKIHSVK